MTVHPVSLPVEGQTLAVVDMAVSDKSALAKTVRKACIDAGFFYLINHGISQDLIDAVFKQSKQFFDLPTEEKLKVKVDQNHRGYTPKASENLDPDNSKKADTNEGYYVGWDLPLDHPWSAKPLHGPNQWPSKDLLPRWKEILEKYYSEVLQLGHTMASLIALSLDLDADYFRNMFTAPMVALRLLHYSAVISNPDHGEFGSGAHSDYGLLTLLMTDSNPGLQICKDRDALPRRWESVAPIKGAFVVNIGDMLERWTNGLYRSTLHRVVLNGVERYSIPYFYEPDFDTLVECIPSCCSSENPPKYPPITSGGHLLGKYFQTYSAFEGKKANGA